MRRDSFECPARERCLARDSAMRALTRGATAAVAATAPAASERIGIDESMTPALTGPADRFMTVKSLISSLTQQEDLNFLLTNRIPRAALTRFMGWFSKIENPVVRDFSIGCWKLFSDLDLSEAKKIHFKSLHDCFVRELKPGLRPVDADPHIVVSPSDGIIGAHGSISDGELFQIKGAPYSLIDLIGDPALVETHRSGKFVTLRLTSSMYHRFHAPHDAHVEQVTLIHGDTWNVNPIALKRIEKLFCKNERAVIRTRLPNGALLTLVPVAAILVASIRLEFIDVRLHLRYRGPNIIPSDAALSKGQEMGWFEHGSTIIVFAPEGVSPCAHLAEGHRIRMGEALMRLP